MNQHRKHHKLYARHIIAVAVMLTFFSVGLYADQMSSLTRGDTTPQVQIHATMVNGFVHPGIGLTQAILENARAQVQATRDPWYSGFRKMAEHAHSSQTVTCRNQKQVGSYEPDDDAFNSTSTQGRLKQDADKAYRQALMYYFTGNEVYRANAMNIIRVWSNMDPDKYANYREDHIHASYPFKDMVMAAELMRYTSSSNPELAWTDQDTDDFSENFVRPSVNTFFNQNGWFMNQNGYPLAAAMSGDIFLNDRQNYEKRVEWFTVNKTAPNKGWSSSITDLARWVTTNDLTGEPVAEPQVQLIEMGRDQAHAGGDVEIFQNTARMMNAQGTRVDPNLGIIATDANAVGPYEFLNDRILAVADFFCRFMLGYDTPWIPVAMNIAPNGDIRQVYPRIADNYRGRIRGLDFWDMYYYYTYVKDVNVPEQAPYYYEAFTKRIVNSDMDWIYIPAEVLGELPDELPEEDARVPQTVQEPEEVEVDERSTGFGNALVLEEGSNRFLRAVPSELGNRIAFLSMDTDSKTVGMRVRTTGVVTMDLSGLSEPWLLPNTQGRWRYVAYRIKAIERWRDIVFINLKGSPETTVDFDLFLRQPGSDLSLPTFVMGNESLELVAFVGAPMTLDLSAVQVNGRISYGSLDKPEGSQLNSRGTFTWQPSQPGEYHFIVNITQGKVVTPRTISIVVAADRQAAMQTVRSAYDPNVAYLQASLQNALVSYDALASAMHEMSDTEFWEGLLGLQEVFNNLEVLTPLLPDGSIDFPKIVVSSDIGDAIGLLIDGNDDTFPVYTLARDMDYIFDFGSGFKVSFTAFAMEGRLNFEDRVDNTLFYGSNDQQQWTRLTSQAIGYAVELERVEVIPSRQDDKFRYLRIQRHGSGLFEPSELWIYGQRYETGRSSL